MDSTRAIAGKGLFYVFAGQIVSLFTFIPFLGGFVGLAALAISIYGSVSYTHLTLPTKLEV